MAASLKSRLVRPVHRAAMWAGFSGWRARTQPVGRIMMFHGVGPGDDLSQEALDASISWIARHFSIVPLGDVIESLRQGRAPRGDVALTFDDGLKCHLDQVYPVLLRHAAPATFFVCPGLIEDRRWLWNHEARIRLRTVDAQARSELACRWGAPVADADRLVDWMKGLPIERRVDVETDIRAASGRFAPTAAQRARFDPLSWDDFQRLDPRIVTVGSHTMQHPILPTLDDETLSAELAQSRSLLEQRLGREVDLFCYPNGSNDLRVRAAAARVYGAAVTTESGIVDAGANVHRLPRIPATERLPLLAWRMHRPSA